MRRHWLALAAVMLAAAVALDAWTGQAPARQPAAIGRETDEGSEATAAVPFTTFELAVGALSAADHEQDEGVFSIVIATLPLPSDADRRAVTLVTPPGSPAFHHLRTHRGRRVRLVLQVLP